MRVKILQSRGGVDVSYDAGEEYEIPEARAERWVAAGYAELIGTKKATPPAIEKAIEPPAEVPEIEPVVEAAVKPPAPERATKGRRK